MKTMYSTSNAVAREVCDTIGFDFGIRFVSALRRGGRIYVRGTCGKPNEFRLLRSRCEEHGYRYVGIDPR